MNEQWKVIPTPGRADIRDGDIVVGHFCSPDKAARVVEDHKACEWFADPMEAVKLLVEFLELSATYGRSRDEARRLQDHPAFRPPGDADEPATEGEAG